MSQERFAAEYLGATQGALFQYIDGRIPLNLDAAIKFAAGLNVKIDDISPTLAQRIRSVMGSDQEPLLPLQPMERELIGSYRKSQPRWQLSLRLLATVATRDMDEVAESVNMVLAKVFSRPLSEIKPVPDSRVEQALSSSRHGFPPGRPLFDSGAPRRGLSQRPKSKRR